MLGLYDYSTSAPIRSTDFDFDEHVERVIEIGKEARQAQTAGDYPHTTSRKQVPADHSAPTTPTSPSLSITSAISSPSTTTSAPSVDSAKVTLSSRRLSRKLPPRLTESLENLALQNSPKGSSFSGSLHGSNHGGHGTKLEPFILETAAPAVFDEHYSLHAAETPVSEKSSKLRKSISKATIGNPTPISDSHSHTLPSTPSMPLRKMSAATTAPSTPSTYILTPSSSVRNFPRRSMDCASGSASTCGTWSLVDEIELAEKAARLRRDPKKESKKEKKERKQKEQESFDQTTPPEIKALYEASLMDVIAEDGTAVKFGDLVRRRRTIVIFIRHWFCPLCAQYMESIISQVNPETLDEAGVDLVIIGNGSKKMLPSYRNKAFKCPFPIYTDPTLALYRAMGLTRQTGDAGPDSEAGDYLTQTPLESTLATIKRATQMPIRNPGHFFQLGGEFVFESTLNVSYTHRMITTRSHSPIRDVCAAAGVRLEWVHYEPGPPPPPVHRNSVLLESVMEGEDGISTMGSVEREERERENAWKMQRDGEVERMKAMKEARRMGARWGETRRTVEVRVVGRDEDDLVGEFGALGLAR